MHGKGGLQRGTVSEEIKNHCLLVKCQVLGDLTRLSGDFFCILACSYSIQFRIKGMSSL